MTKKKIGTYVFLIVSVLLIYFLLKDMNYKDFMKQTANVNLKMVGIASLFMLLSAWFRNIRWLMLFLPLGYKIKKWQAFSALLLSYPANLIIPQSSIFVRTTYLKKMSGVPFSECLGTIIAEKLMDGVVVFGLFFLLLFSNFSFNFNLFKNYKLLFDILFGSLFVLWLSVFVLKTYFTDYLKTTRKFLVSQFLDFKIGLMTTRQVSNKSLLVLYTLAIWLPYFVIFYFLLHASVETDLMNLKLPIELATMANISWIFPTQGGFGSYHFLIAEVMKLHGFEKVQSIFFAFFSHAIITLCDILFGIIVLLSNKKTIFSLFK